MSDWLDTTDQGLRIQGGKMSAGISAAPAAVGLSAADATNLADNLAAYEAKLDLVNDETKATKIARAEKATAKSVLAANMRGLAKRIIAFGIPDAKKIELGLPVYSAEHQPLPVPQTRPVASVVAVIGTTLVLRTVDELTPTRRKRPRGVLGAEVFSRVGSDELPVDLEKWRFEGAFFKSTAEIGFNPEDAGKRIVLVARWFNRRGAGPLSDRVVTAIAAAVPEAA
jgi:hypothetical protein